LTGQQTPNMPNILTIVNKPSEKMRAQTNNSPFKPYNLTMGQQSIFDTPKLGHHKMTPKKGKTTP
tara:strand:+ start:1883 stop:2077 length:195 start_codon:yes stop_codon:yes gene_type:complete